GSDELDLTGSFTRADARSVTRYVPITVLKGVRPWLERAFVSGQSTDTKFRVKGKIADFPFADNKGGIFSVTAHITGGTLDYADGWPRISNIDGDLQFRGRRMAVSARQGTISNVRLSNVRAQIPNLDADKAVLSVSGEAEGQTADFLGFIAKSPVNDMLDRFTEEMRGRGAGRLTLSLTLPLANLRDTRVNGAYQFANNQIVVDPAIPPLDQANGRVEFTESTVRVPNAAGVFLGGPATISGNTQRDGTIRVTMQGRIDADNVRRLGGPPLMQHLRGATDWRGAFTVQKKSADLVVESSLQGITSDLPVPLAKSAADAIPLRIERRFGGAQPQRMRLTYGDIASAILVLRTEGQRTLIDRGVVRLGGGSVTEPDRPGVWVSGSVKSLGFDEWLKFAGDPESGSAYTLGGMQVTIASMDFFGRSFHDVSVKAINETGGFNIAVAGREFEGNGDWRPEGKGRLTARFRKLILPPAETRLTELKDRPPSKPLELPALGIVIDDFQLGEKRLGRLEIYAVPENRDWRIERLHLTSPESTLT
ncbi:MAG TPA: DUF3971 domain-containing protein, partial [Burkholderiales bacterium]|nr:DUF3971 domain-containing protein [Burkholderiales bacterium]